MALLSGAQSFSIIKGAITSRPKSHLETSYFFGNDTKQRTLPTQS